MSSAHRAVSVLLILSLLAVGAWRLWRPVVLDVRPAPLSCTNPFVIHDDARTIARCLPRGIARVSDLVAGCSTSITVRAGELLRVEPRCRPSVAPIPAPLRLTLGLPLDLNQASEDDLVALPRIGPVLARRILAERQRGGRFVTVEELRRVRGIGPATLQRLRPLVTAR
jgi:competence ComEA-like helix-hairpin-helix protein